MDICESVTLIDESISSVFDTYSCDAIVHLKNGNKFMLEIKHTDKDVYKISEGNFDKRVDYAKKHSLDLYFAISIKGLWMVFHSNYIKKKNRKIEISDYRNSKLTETFDIQSYIISNFEFKSIYAERDKNYIEIKYPPYGWLISEEIKYRGTRKYKIKKKDKLLYLYTFALEGIKDRASKENHTVTTDSGFTIIIDKFSDDSKHVISELELLLAPIQHIIQYDDVVFTPKNYLSKLSELGEKSPFNIGILRAVLEELKVPPFKMIPPSK
jgi:Holliday junction resolvase